MGLSYSVVYNHVSLLFIFLLKLLQLWPLQTLSGGLLCPLTCPHPFVGICLLSGTKMCSMFICGGISLFLGTLVPFTGEGIQKTRDIRWMHAWFLHAVYLLVLSQETELGNGCVQANPSTSINIHHFLCLKHKSSQL